MIAVKLQRRFSSMQSKTSADTLLKLKKNINISKCMVYIIFLVVLSLFAIFIGGSFFSLNNILNIIRQTAVVSMIAVTMTFVIAIGEIDLSVGSTIGLSGLMAALVLQSTDNIPLAILAALAVGLVVGLINGLLIVALNLPSFLVTLGMQMVLVGTSMWITNTTAIPIGNTTFTFIFGGGSIGKLPLLLLWVLITGAVGYIVLNRTPYGKKVLAVGGNATSARYSGINVKKIVVYVFVYSSLMAALGGMLYAGRMSSGRYTFGDGLELDAIASVILGGTSMAGGNGSIVGAIIGSLLIGTINNGLMFFGLSTAQQTVAKGAIIILSVALSALVSLRDNNNK
jgi:ribose/xylose/arabinose/galactoside ABC-type transport system permease subunit